MTITKSSFRGRRPVEQRAANSASTGAGGAFPGKMPGEPGDETTGAGKGKRTLEKYAGKVAGAPPTLTTPGGALGKTGGGP
jgi:hypothetical protein